MSKFLSAFRALLVMFLDALVRMALPRPPGLLDDSLTFGSLLIFGALKAASVASFLHWGLLELCDDTEELDLTARGRLHVDCKQDCTLLGGDMTAHETGAVKIAKLNCASLRSSCTICVQNAGAVTVGFKSLVCCITGGGAPKSAFKHTLADTLQSRYVDTAIFA